MLKKLFLFLFLWGVTLFSYAAIYESRSDGTIIYSDTPMGNAQKVEVPEVNMTISQPEITPPAALNPGESDLPLVTAEKRLPYKTFLIASPKDQDTIQNQLQISVQMTVEPALQKGDKIQLLVDGALWGEPVASTSLILNGVNRGTHQVYAVLLNKNQTVIKQSNTITIYVHRATAQSLPNRSG